MNGRLAAYGESRRERPDGEQALRSAHQYASTGTSRSCGRLSRSLLAAFVWVSGLTSAGAAWAAPDGRPRAVLVAGAPLPPGAAVLSVLHRKLGAGYHLLEEPSLVRELESLERPRSPEQLVSDALKDALQRMRRLALEEVQRTLEEAEPHLQQLPPTPAARALFAAAAARRAHVALLREDNAQAVESLQRALSADPELTLDQAQEPPTLVDLVDKVRSGLREAKGARLRVTTSPEGALVVVGGRPLGRAPITIDAPDGAAVLVWAVLDGYRPRAVTARAAAGGPPLSVDIQLEPFPFAQRLRPLIDALRGLTPQTRPGAARALRDALSVDSVVLVQLGPGGRPRLSVYGAPPRSAAALADLDLILESSPGAQRRSLPPWLWGIFGAALGAGLATGVILGTMGY